MPCFAVGKYYGTARTAFLKAIQSPAKHGGAVVALLYGHILIFYLYLVIGRDVFD